MLLTIALTTCAVVYELIPSLPDILRRPSCHIVHRRLDREPDAICRSQRAQDRQTLRRCSGAILAGQASGTRKLLEFAGRSERPSLNSPLARQRPPRTSSVRIVSCQTGGSVGVGCNRLNLGQQRFRQARFDEDGVATGAVSRSKSHPVGLAPCYAARHNYPNARGSQFHR
jgi:hypothetical protein